VKFANGTIIMLNIPKKFQAKSTLQSDRRDVIDDVIVPSLIARWQGTLRPSLALIGQFQNVIRFF
jgi:hypothetical protein